MSCNKASETGAAVVATGSGKYGSSYDATPPQPVAGEKCMTAGTTEHESARARFFLPSLPQPLHSCAVLELLFEKLGVEAAIAPWDLCEVDVVLDSEVMKRNQRTFSDAITNGSLPCQNIVEQSRDIDAIGALRCGCEPERKRRPETCEHTAVTGSLRMMDFVNDDVVEGMVGEFGKAFRASEFLNRGNDEAASHIAARPQIPGDRNVFPNRSQCNAECRFCLRENFGTMSNNQHSRRPPQQLPSGHDVECRQPSLPKSRGDGDQCSPVAIGADPRELFEGGHLPWSRSLGFLGGVD